MTQQTQDAKSSLLHALYEFGKYIAYFEANAAHIEELIVGAEDRVTHKDDAASVIGNKNKNLTISFARDEEEQRHVEEHKDTVETLFALNYISYSPFMTRLDLLNKSVIDFEGDFSETAEKLINSLAFSMFHCFIEDEQFDLSTLKEDRKVFKHDRKTVFAPSDAQTLVEFLSLLQTTTVEEQVVITTKFQGTILNGAEFTRIMTSPNKGKEQLLKEVSANINEVKDMLKKHKSTPEYIAKRNEMAHFYPSLVKEYKLAPKPEAKKKPEAEIAVQAVQPAAIAAHVEKAAPVNLSVNGASVVRMFEGKFDALMSRLRSKPSDKRFDEQNNNLTWENYCVQKEAINQMIDTKRSSTEIISSRQLAVLTDFFSYNFGKDLGEKKDFFKHGVLALAISDLKNKGIAVDEGLVAKAVSELGLSDSLGKMKQPKFDAEAFLGKLSKLETAKDKSPTRACGIALLAAVAKGEEKLISSIKADLEAAASASSPQARQSSLQRVRETGQSTRDIAA